MTLSIIVFTITYLYSGLIIILLIGWKRVYNFIPEGNENINKKISIVVACRNEEDHIRNLISTIAVQSYSNFELILVNDHSTDFTRSYILSAKTQLPNIILVDAEGFGKKNAIKEGILRSSTDFIITTDADCTPSFHWLETIVCHQQNYPADLLICPVKLSINESMLSYLQVIEFSTLVATGASSAGLGMPILCNAANMAFKKSVWLKCREDLHENEQSGDDIFLLQSVKKRGGVIQFLKSESAFVTANSATSLTEFIQQRRRWASKTPSYTDWHILLVAIVVLAICLLEIVLLYLSFFSSTALVLLITVFSIKYILDNLFLLKIQQFFQLDNTWIHSLVMSVFYPFYIVFVGLSALVLKPKKWK